MGDRIDNLNGNHSLDGEIKSENKINREGSDDIMNAQAAENLKKYHFFNEDFKEEFIISNYTASANNVRNIFELCSDMEYALNKDLGNFNLFEVDNLLRNLNRGSLSSVSTTLSMLRKYTDYVIEKGKSPTRINYYRAVKGKEKLKKYVNPQSEKIAGKSEHDRLGRYVTREKLHDVMNICVNAQDAALFGLFFEGVGGEAHEEIINLKKQDCNFETGDIILTSHIVVNKITKETKEIKRTLKITDKVILNRLKKAVNQTEYEANNGANMHLNHPIYSLKDNDYVFRPTVVSPREQMTVAVINGRIKLISKIYRNEFINAQNLFFSGVIDYCKQLKQDLNIDKLEEKHFKKVVKHFNMSDNDNYWYSIQSRIEEFI